MSKRVYTCIEEREDGTKSVQTFEGFSRFIKDFPETGQYLALVEVFGELEVFWLDDAKEAVEELQRYYRMGLEQEMKIKVYKVSALE